MSSQLTTGLSGMIMFNTKLTSQCNSVVVRHNWAESFHEAHELFQTVTCQPAAPCMSCHIAWPLYITMVHNVTPALSPRRGVVDSGFRIRRDYWKDLLTVCSGFTADMWLFLFWAGECRVRSFNLTRGSIYTKRAFWHEHVLLGISLTSQWPA